MQIYTQRSRSIIPYACFYTPTYIWMCASIHLRIDAFTDRWIYVRPLVGTEAYAEGLGRTFEIFVWMFVITYVRMNIWLIAQTNVRTDIQTKVRTHLQTFDRTFEQSFVWMSECLKVVASGIWASVQLKRRLCLKRFLIVRNFPTFPQSCPTFPHFFLDKNLTTLPDCYICGSRHTQLFSHRPQFQRLHTIIISVWIGTDIMDRHYCIHIRTAFMIGSE